MTTAERQTTNLVTSHTSIEEKLSFSSSVSQEQTVQESLIEIEKKIEDISSKVLLFKGKSKDDNAYIRLSEMLLKCRICLDDLILDGEDNLQSRNRLIKEILRIQESLDKMIYTEPKYEEQSAFIKITSMEHMENEIVPNIDKAINDDEKRYDSASEGEDCYVDVESDIYENVCPSVENIKEHKDINTGHTNVAKSSFIVAETGKSNGNELQSSHSSNTRTEFLRSQSIPSPDFQQEPMAKTYDSIPMIQKKTVANPFNFDQSPAKPLERRKPFSSADVSALTSKFNSGKMDKKSNYSAKSIGTTSDENKQTSFTNLKSSTNIIENKASYEEVASKQSTENKLSRLSSFMETSSPQPYNQDVKRIMPKSPGKFSDILKQYGF